MSNEGQDTPLDIGADAPGAVVMAPPAIETLTIPEPPAAKHYFWGTGRRKRAVARVRIRPGKGKIIVNKRELDKYFRSEEHTSELQSH